MPVPDFCPALTALYSVAHRIVTQEFASKCYLTRLLDTRFAGMAVGVGSSRILGRIHQAPLKVGVRV